MTDTITARARLHEALIAPVTAGLTEWTEGCNRRQHQDGDHLMAVGERTIGAVLDVVDAHIASRQEALARLRELAHDIDEPGSDAIALLAEFDRIVDSLSTEPSNPPPLAQRFDLPTGDPSGW